MKPTNKVKSTKKVTIAKEGKHWIIRGLKHGSGIHRLFSTEMRALEAASSLFPGSECVCEK